MKNKDVKFIKKCFLLARKGEGKTSPNPIVGAILVDENNKIVSEGYHKGYGLNHAEVDCINNYEKKNGNKVDYSKLTMYVNLEPCNHYGKTPPCAELIIKKRIKKVVVASLDPNKDHSGGVKKMEDAGVEVKTGVLENEAIKLNEIFYKNVKEKLPFVAIKTATTLDGKIASKTGSSKWITSEKSRKYVQKLRNKYDGILTSSSTIIADNPSLTARGKGYKNPARIILDSTLRTNPNSKVFADDGTPVFLIYCSEKINKTKDYPKNVTLIKAKEKNEKIDIKDLLKKLFKSGICSIMVESGGTLNGTLLKENLVDKIYHFAAPKILGDTEGKSFVHGFDISDINECRNFKISTLKNLNPDILIEYYPE